MVEQFIMETTRNELLNLSTDVLLYLVPISWVRALESEESHENKASKNSKSTLKMDALTAWVRRAVLNQDFAAETGQVLNGYALEGVKARHVILLGVGEATTEQLQTALGAITPQIKTLFQVATASGKAGDAKQNLVKKVLPKDLLISLLAFEPQKALDLSMTIHHAVMQWSYVYCATKPSAMLSNLKKVNLAVAKTNQEIRKSFQNLQIVMKARAKGVWLTKEWANRPSNHATPTHLAQVAKNIVKNTKNLTCTVLGKKEIAKLGMGAFLAVAQGSEQEPKLIELRYQGTSKKEKPIVLVGKGITFDTGGISLKPAPEMDEMKFDMSGAASVLGVFQALAELEKNHQAPKINVIGIIAACENMPSGQAVKPGDVVTSMSGQTIEILNTDAEGRLILCDALTYAQQFKPQALIDIATLTGACMIALGGVRSGLFSNDSVLRNALEIAGEQAQDLCWAMPLDNEYAQGLKTNFADVANVAGRAAGAVTAAKFLQRFVGSCPWAHIDIAGTAWLSGANKGATGRPVGMLLKYILNKAE